MENSSNFADYIAIAKRRFWHALILFLVLSVAAVVVINGLPPVYRASASIAVELQQASGESAQSNGIGYATGRIGDFRQRVTNEAKLGEIVEKLQLLPQAGSQAARDSLVAELRANIFLYAVSDRPIHAREAPRSLAFRLSVEHGDPETAAAIAKELVALFVEEEEATQGEKAKAADRSKREAERLSDRVAAMETRIAEYKKEHTEVLPERLTLRKNMLRTQEKTLKALESKIKATEQEKRMLETRRSSEGAAGSAGDEGTDATSDTGKRVFGSADAARAQIESQIRSAKVRLASLRKQEDAVRGRVEELKASLDETSQVERGLADLTRGYEKAVAELGDFTKKQQAPESEENREDGQQAERFVLLAPPRVRATPVRPDKPSLYSTWITAAAGSAVFVAILAELLDATIRGPAMLSSLLRSQPLAIIPYIECSQDRRRKQLRFARYVFSAAALLLLALLMTQVSG